MQNSRSLSNDNIKNAGIDPERTMSVFFFVKKRIFYIDMVISDDIIVISK